MTSGESVAFYAPLKPPDHPAPSGDRRIARLFRSAFQEIGIEAPVASRFRSRDAAGDPAFQARMAALGPKLAERALRDFRANPPRAWFTYHLYYKAADWFGPEAAAALNIPYILAEASYAPKRAGGPWDRAHRRVAWAVRQAAAVLCLNPNDKACLAPLVDDPSKLIDFPPFLDIAPYADARLQRAAARAEIAGQTGAPVDACWLLAVGMMRDGDKAASYEALARALPLLDASRDWRLLVVGDGPARSRIEGELRAASDGRAVFCGLQDEAGLARHYAAADVMVWPAVREAFGMAMLEAQASGLPVVAGRVGGVAAVVEDGKSGILTADGDDRAFAAAISAMMADESRRDAYGLTAAARVRDQQSLAAAADRLASLLERVAR